MCSNFPAIIAESKKTGRNIAQLVPLYSDNTNVLNKLKIAALEMRHALQDKYQIKEEDAEGLEGNILIALVNIIRRNLETIVHSPIIRAKVDLKNSSYLSPSKIRKSIKEVEEEKESATNDQKLKQLFSKLKIISNFAELNEAEQQEVLHELKVSINEATGIFEKMTEKVKERIETDIFDGIVIPENLGEGAKLPNVHKDITRLHPYQMAQKLFLGNHIHPGEYNDIQSVLAMGFTLFKHKMTPTRKIAEREEEALKASLQDHFLAAERAEGERVTGLRTMYRYQNGEFKEGPYKETTYLREVEIDGERHPVLMTGLNLKKPASLMQKTFINEGNRNMEIEDTPDLLRSRFVLWGISSEEMHGSKKDLVEKIAKHAGTSQGLREHPDKDKKDLGPEEFKIEAPKKKNGAMMKYSIYGVSKNGTHTEIQLIPQDVHELVNAIDSPLAPDKYKEDQTDELYLMLVPESVSQITHVCLNRKRKAYAAEREQAKQALFKLQIERGK